jgi:predicted CopG family antitoxin
MKRLVIPDVIDDLKALYKKIEPKIARYGTLSEEEVNEIVQRHRKVKSR